jgi:exodeoxyribonuclease V alpha subunit
MIELPCIIERVTFKNDNGFAVLSCNLDAYSKKYKEEMEELVEDCISEKYNSFTVTLGMWSQEEKPNGGQYVFCGDFIQDKKFGKQFKADFYYQDAPTTEDGLKVFLMSLPNIKESRSEAIIKKFGVDGVVEILDNDIGRLLEISGINEKRIDPIKKAWDEKKCLRELYGWLTLHKINVGIADKAYKKWGKDALKTIKENPYRLVEIRGIGFLTADLIAHQVDKNIPVDYRVTACIKYILEENLNSQSNLCIPYPVLKKNLVAVLMECDQNLGTKVDSKIYLNLVAKCLKDNLSLFVIVKDIPEDNIYIYLKDIWDKEYYIAKSIWNRKEFNHEEKTCSDEDIEKAEKSLSVFYGRKMELDDCQKEAIRTAFDHKISIITGAGGTGKSLICRCIYTIAKEKGKSIRMMSPTGKAAQVLSEKTGAQASTIHRGLQLRKDDLTPKQVINEDILLIDEISMSGLDTMYAIMKALEGNQWAHIVFVGDKNQLPSVSPGNFLSDIMESSCAHIVTLSKIHRQDENSYISFVANEISKGKVTLVPDLATDIRWRPLSPVNLHDEIIAFIDQYRVQNKIEDLQFISPMKKGICGVYKLNEVIQKKMAEINGTEAESITIGFQKFHKGDRVIQIENNYEKMVFNGDMGTIRDLGEKVIDPSVSDKKEKFLVVEIYGEPVEYYGEELSELILAWAITVHKFQGSQSKNIVFVMAEEAQIMMSKELVYTAFTRAEKMLNIFGNEHMLRLAPTRSIVKKRYTNVKRIIDQFKSNEKILEVMEQKKEIKK